jgi:hypothetical protein
MDASGRKNVSGQAANAKENLKLEKNEKYPGIDAIMGVARLRYFSK